MSDVLNCPVLVLNRGWSPIHIKTVKDAICDVVAECAKIIDHKDISFQYEWSEWSELVADEGDKVVHTSRLAIRVPEIIVLTEYKGIPNIEIRLTRRNLLLRDKFRCQYCGDKISSSTMTLDHITPRSRGGKNSWENLTASCFPCNIRKRDRTPKEAGMVLHSKPEKPHWYPLASRFGMNSPVSWHHFLPVGTVPAF